MNFHATTDKQKKKTRRRARPRLTLAAKIGLIILLLHGLVAILGPVLAPESPAEIVSDDSFLGVGECGLLGSDYLGRDLYSRMLHGARMTIGTALIATIAGFLIGMALGFTGAEVGGWVDNAISAFVDLLISFPPILLSLVVIVALGNSLLVLVATVAVIHAPRVARVGRAIAMDVATKDFVEVARTRGEGLWSILSREIWPNTIRSLAAEFGLRLTFSILFLSSLSFLGLGIQPPTADWGVMVRENMSGLLYGSGAALFPAGAIASISVGINLVVDWIVEQTGQEISGEMLK